MISLRPAIRTLRPKQWVKNIFVAAPLVFAKDLLDPSRLWREAVAVFAFCLLSGAVYAFNDVRDVEADRVHPTKCKRPIAAGELSESGALWLAGVLSVVALGGCLAIHWQLAAWAALYLAQNVAYSVKLKHVAFLDVILVSGGFVLRVVAGAAAIDVPPSLWLLACASLLALFLGLGKRAHELAWAQRSGKATATRAALAGYRLPMVQQLMVVLALATCGAYVAYTLDAHTVAFFGTRDLVFSAPFVLLGVARFLALALWWPTQEPPTDAMMRDPWFLTILAGATATVLVIIYK
ncbi:MAG TPA: UbiA prenyltransferase family protein [Kofleriaceae bacterium]